MGSEALDRRRRRPTRTDVPFQGDAKPDKAYNMMGDPRDEGGEGVGFTSFVITVTDSESEFLEWVAAYRNAMAEAKGKKLRRRWTRKTVAESLESARIVQEKKDFAELLEGVGKFPAADDAVGMLRFAKAVIKWNEEKEKRGK